MKNQKTTLCDTRTMLRGIVANKGISISEGQYSGKPNTLYIINEITDYLEIPKKALLDGNVVSVIDVMLTTEMPDVYPELITHLKKASEMHLTMKPVNTTKEDVVQINVNGTCIAYYVPSTNSFVMGNLLWHNDYVTIVMKNIWPQIVEKLKIP